MKVAKINDWLQIVTAIGVLVGLYLVVEEIRQNNNLAKAETINNLHEGWEHFSISEYETDIAALFIRSIKDPDNLTPPEVVKLNAYFTAITSLYGRQWVLYRQYDLALDPTVDTEYAAGLYFSGRFARSWFQENRIWLQDIYPEMVRVLSRQIESQPVDTDFDIVKRLKSNL